MPELNDYECELCGTSLPPGVLSCPGCGDEFDEPVPGDVLPASAEISADASILAAPILEPPAPILEPPAPVAAEPEPITAEPEISPAAPHRRAARRPRVWLPVGALAGLLALALFAWQHHAPAAPALQSAGTVAVGDDGVLYAAGVDVLVAINEQAEIELSDAASASNTVAYGKVVQQKRAYPVPSQTRVQLVGYGHSIFGDSLCQVRIESGTHTSQLGWVPKDWLLKP